MTDFYHSPASELSVIGRDSIYHQPREGEIRRKGGTYTTLSPRWNVCLCVCVPVPCVYIGKRREEYKNQLYYVGENAPDSLPHPYWRATNPLNLLFFFFSFVVRVFFPHRHSTSGWLAIPDAAIKASQPKNLTINRDFRLPFLYSNTTNVGGKNSSRRDYFKYLMSHGYL